MGHRGRTSQNAGERPGLRRVGAFRAVDDEGGAREHLTEAGLIDLVEVRKGDALKTLARDLPDALDLVLLMARRRSALTSVNLHPQTCDLAHITSKGSIHSLTRALANVLGDIGIAVNAITPLKTEDFIERRPGGLPRAN